MIDIMMGKGNTPPSIYIQNQNNIVIKQDTVPISKQPRLTNSLQKTSSPRIDPILKLSTEVPNAEGAAVGRGEA
jgi:hypothetical protein